MATAVRLTGVGAFGRAVVAHLAEACPPADVHVVVLWRPSPALCRQLDAESFRTGRPWLPIIAEHPTVLVGPWIAPPDGPCFRCYTARRAQHDTRPRVTSALGEAYDADARLGPQGFLPHHARVVAALALLAVAEPVAGRIASFDVHSGHIGAQHVVGVHGCPRCDASGEIGPRDGRSLAAFAGTLR